MRMPLWMLRWMHRSHLSRRKLRGGFLHSKLGDRLLDKSLWRPTHESLARAWLVGFPITIIPFLPLQTLFACIAGFFVRGNLILCIALQFLSTPLTAPIHLPACYLVGELVRGRSFGVVWERVRSAPLQMASVDAAISLYLGAFILGTLIGAIGYAVIQKTWRQPPPAKRPKQVEPPPPTI
jgi:uncharacterized protein